MPGVDLGDIQLAWEYGPGFAHACSHFKNPEMGPRASYARRLREIAAQLDKGSLSDEVAAHRVAAATAAFVYHLEHSIKTVTVSAVAVGNDDPPVDGQTGTD